MEQNAPNGISSQPSSAPVKCLSLPTNAKEVLCPNNSNKHQFGSTWAKCRKRPQQVHFVSIHLFARISEVKALGRWQKFSCKCPVNEEVKLTDGDQKSLRTAPLTTCSGLLSWNRMPRLAEKLSVERQLILSTSYEKSVHYRTKKPSFFRAAAGKAK